jgi:hypothetical protein
MIRKTFRAFRYQILGASLVLFTCGTLLPITASGALIPNGSKLEFTFFSDNVLFPIGQLAIGSGDSFDVEFVNVAFLVSGDIRISYPGAVPNTYWSSPPAQGFEFFDVDNAIAPFTSGFMLNSNIPGLQPTISIIDEDRFRVSFLSSWIDPSYSFDASVSVPAPVTLALFGLGLSGLVWSRRKRA